MAYYAIGFEMQNARSRQAHTPAQDIYALSDLCTKLYQANSKDRGQFLVLIGRSCRFQTLFPFLLNMLVDSNVVTGHGIKEAMVTLDGHEKGQET